MSRTEVPFGKSVSRPRAREEVVRKVSRFILEGQLLLPGERILVAVSGGPDSIALLSILRELAGRWNWTLGVAHVNHSLRGSEAQEDLEFVGTMAEQMGIQFLYRTVPPGTLGTPGRSLEEEAREARYRLLEEMRAEFGGSSIAVGHHRGDQAETVLAALGRGAGPGGLAGMCPRTGRIVRPLLCLEREEILSYLQEKGLAYRVDSTNEDRRYLRVRIRKEVLPLLEKWVNPSIVKALCRTAEICHLEDDYLQTQVERLWPEVGEVSAEEVRICGEKYRTLHKAMRLRLLRRAYELASGSTKSLEHVHVEAMDRLAMSPGREKYLDLPRKVRFILSMGDMIMERTERPTTRSFSYPVEIPGLIEIPEAGVLIKWEISRERIPPHVVAHGQGAIMDLDKLEAPFLVRSPKAADRMRPKGLGGSKKLQDLLMDAHVPRRKRWTVPVVEDAKGIIWVVGYRMDERVAPGPRTTRFLVARVEKLKGS
jgi:tRNA(Ile)-lysidine synthase